MKDKYTLMAAGVSVLLTAVFVSLLWMPKNTEVREINAESDRVVDQQMTAARTVAELEEVRDNADQYRVELAAAQSIVPFSLSMGELLDQLQGAAELAGVELSNFTHARATHLELLNPPQVPVGRELVAHDVQFSVSGDYFAVAEFARVMEDPTLVPRGFAWQALSVAEEEYPQLTAVASGRAFGVVPAGGIEEPVEDEPDEDDDADGDDGDDADDE